MRLDLAAWDQLHGGRFGLSTRKATPFDIEGAEFSPDDSALYLGFRYPVAPNVVGGKALIVPVLNIDDLTSGEANQARFGEPILMDLGGDSIREIRKNDRDEYLILSSPTSTSNPHIPSQQTLWAWNGDPEVKPRKLTTVLPKDVEPVNTDNSGAWEGIGEMPQRLTAGASVRLIMDQGYDVLYDAGENKDDANDWTSKARTDVVTLAGAVGTVSGLSNPGEFPTQAVGTAGTPRAVTVTNTGSNVLHIGDAYTEDDDSASADEFLLTGDSCSDKTLAPDETCTVRVRFQPFREHTTSSARLVVESDVPGGTTSVALTGTSTTLPQGPRGATGMRALRAPLALPVRAPKARRGRRGRRGLPA